MDFVCFFLGLWGLVLGKDSWVLTIIFILSTSYLQTPITDPFFINFGFPHQVSDVGLLLFLLFFLKKSYINGIDLRHPLLPWLLPFLLFIVLNGVVELFLGTVLSDVIKYCRHFLLFGVVFIARFIPRQVAIQSLRQVYYITLVLGVILLLQNLTGHYLIEVRADLGRGTKPPIFSVFGAAMVLVNLWNNRPLVRVFHFLAFFLPIAMNLKMTYVLAVFLIYGCFVFFRKREGRRNNKLLGFSLSIILLGVFLPLFFPKLQERLQSTIVEFTDVRQTQEVSGNFSYRLLHARERWNYISENPFYLIRGMGYVSEEHFGKDIFVLGQPGSNKAVAQLDTGDIAWSLMFIRWGVMGILLYLLFYSKLMYLCFKGRECPFTYYYFPVMVVFLLFCSLGNTFVIDSSFFLYPILFSTKN